MKATLNLSTKIFKAALVLTAVVFFASWAGCSDNMNVTDPLSSNHYAQNQPNNSWDPSNSELIWSLNELKVWTVSESSVENKASYVRPPDFPPLVPENGYRIIFNVTTNAEKFTNGYEPYVSVSKDSKTIFEESNFGYTGETSVSKEIRLRESEFSYIEFYIALFQVDRQVKIPGDAVTLTLSDIKIYRMH